MQRNKSKHQLKVTIFYFYIRRAELQETITLILMLCLEVYFLNIVSFDLALKKKLNLLQGIQEDHFCSFLLPEGLRLLDLFATDVARGGGPNDDVQ